MISLVLIVFCTVFFPGIIVRTKSIASGRKGPGLWQPMKDIRRLFKKGAVYSNTSSVIFRVAPVVYFASLLMAMLMLPFGKHPGILSFEGDFIFFAYVMAAGKFLMIIGALDTGSSFEGMGASREALYSMLIEPAFFVLMAAFAMFTGHTAFYDIFQTLYLDSYLAIFAVLLAVYILFQIAMIENSRMPYDDPKTHLELTMVHEVMVLDNSGFDLGLIQLASALKFAVFGSLMANLFIMPWMPWYLSVLIFLAVQFSFAVSVGIQESFRARHRLRINNQAILTITPVAILVFFSILLIITKQF
ncbi:MAG TPA: NADH-quinone oxidoreductase subunit H [Bacteroidales bacterium]|nr:NADH-quinone oxidoreductase subunit H [Bacteroidales bacterium]